ncbi:MAG: DNA mismatch repair endonuclease MutL [Bacteroides sp.]|nr:DNA mismatch repair endonuclease MutL [Bacteroides sp.]MCM1379622.1 DNA mismatch repair endonuclease MutL [Bacteroides sp.]MCM1445996.1 DNA mismatch repair endonuclease MutL [Prevotella sp.]
MNDVIKLLPDSVANQIAAGEVIQRPASVVKELVENAVDAGATEIQVIIKDAGRTLIQVVDNGCGMSPTDARLAFERHSTSKIRQADDLFSLHTMGFRGEALASICAVSQVDLRTMRRDDKIGTRLLINGSKVESQQPEACAPGSNMMVRNLFFNVPARRKFLKKNSVEMANIIHEFERLALVNPSVELSLVHNDLTLHRLPAANLRQRIIDLFGKQLNDKLIPVDTDTDLVKLHGFIVRPEHCRKRNALQFLFVNGRNMRHPYFHKAIMQTYEPLIPADEQPTYFLDFNVDPQSIDVNIHPTKNEIKFEQEQAIRQILYAAVKETIGRFSTAPEIDFDTMSDPARIDIPAPGKKVDSGQWTVGSDKSYNPFKAPSAQNWEELYKNFTAAKQEAIIPDLSGEQSLINGNEVESGEWSVGSGGVASALIPIGKRYVAMADPRGIRIVDLHRAHQSVLYERIAATLHSGEEISSQRLIFPEKVALGTIYNPIMDDLEPQLAAIGFDIAPLGGGEWSVNAVPAIVDDANPGELLAEIVSQAAEAVESAEAPLSPLIDRIAAGMARAGAFKATRNMTDAEIGHVISQLMTLKTPGFTPDGNPTFTVLSDTEISSLL